MYLSVPDLRTDRGVARAALLEGDNVCLVGGRMLGGGFLSSLYTFAHSLILLVLPFAAFLSWM